MKKSASADFCFYSLNNASSVFLFSVSTRYLNFFLEKKIVFKMLCKRGER